jgi:hypothetical protein
MDCDDLLPAFRRSQNGNAVRSHHCNLEPRARCKQCVGFWGPCDSPFIHHRDIAPVNLNGSNNRFGLRGISQTKSMHDIQFVE